MSNNDLLNTLREIEVRQGRRPRMTFAEWSAEQDQIKKAGGRSVAHYSPGFGNMGSMFGGHLNTSSNAPAGPNMRPSGNQMTGLKNYPTTTYDPGQFYNNPPYREGDWPSQFGVQAGVAGNQPSKYRFSRPDQPPNWIDDVDMQSIWYSPFEPVWPFGPPYYNRPREWNFPVGYNLNYIPERMALNQMLRGMRRSWGILATIETTRMDQLLRLSWTIQRKDKPKAISRSVDQMRRFFRRPDGKSSFQQWCRKILFDSFDIDFPILYVDRRPIDGLPRAIEVHDGGTYFPLIDDTGRRPDTTLEMGPDGVTYVHRQPAYQQIIYGLPMVNLSEDEIINPIMRPQPDLPMFGYSPIEQFLTETTEAIRKTFYQLEFWRSGSMPELIVTVPEAWTPRHIATFQAHFDALLSGQLSLKSKVRFVPGGMKPFDIKNASGESLWSQRDELLVRLACFAFSISPQPFVKMMNRGSAAQAQQTAEEEGLYPLMSWFKDDIMDRIIQDVFGFDDIEFVYLPRPEVDLLKQAQIHKIQVDEGLRTRNEIREEMGHEPTEDGDVMTVTTGSGAVPLDVIVAGGALAPGTPAPHKPVGNAKPLSSLPGPGSSPQRGSPRVENSGTQPKTGTSTQKSLHSDVHHAALDAVEPTDGQKEPGNYKKGHVWVQGLQITLETPEGGIRRGHKMDGKRWKSRMAGDYGYIRGTIGADGDQIDVCIGRHPKSDRVFVIDQFDTNTDQFDEHKVMLGYRKPKTALRDYLKSNGDGLGALRAGHLTEMSLKDFKAWLKSGNTRAPIADSGFGELVKSDTISVATGLGWYDQTVPVRRRSDLVSPPGRKSSKSRRKQKKWKLQSGPRWLELGV